MCSSQFSFLFISITIGSSKLSFFRMIPLDVKGLSQPPAGKRLIHLSRQVIQVEMCYCAATVIFIVLLINPYTLPVCIKCNKINQVLTQVFMFMYFITSEHVSVIPQVADTANQIDYGIFRSC